MTCFQTRTMEAGTSPSCNWFKSECFTAQYGTQKTFNNTMSRQRNGILMVPLLSPPPETKWLSLS